MGLCLQNVLFIWRSTYLETHYMHSSILYIIQNFEVTSWNGCLLQVKNTFHYIHFHQFIDFLFPGNIWCKFCVPFWNHPSLALNLEELICHFLQTCLAFFASFLLLVARLAGINRQINVSFFILKSGRGVFRTQNLGWSFLRK